ncbi:protein kinase [Planctomycetota bacterium]
MTELQTNPPAGEAGCPKCGNKFATRAGAKSICPKCLFEFAMEPTDMNNSGVNDEPIFPEGTLIGPYKIINLLGRGGMGTVYKAYQSLLDRFVALKVLPAKLSGDEGFLKRFNREAKMLASLSHPNIVTIHDMGKYKEHYYFIMEFVEGVTTRELIAQRKLPPGEALKIVPQLCDALEYAHVEGIVHRDIKPENILIDKKGRVKIADFGLARIVQGDIVVETITKTQDVMGTYDYMAPEQRASTKTVDHRADIYSLGVVFYEMLTGELPVGRFELPSRKVQIDVRVDDVVMKSLEKEPSKRYQRASQVGTAVTEILSGTAPPLKSVQQETAQKPKNATLIFVLGLLSLVVCPLLGIAAWAVGSGYMKQAREMGVKPEGLAIAGKILGIIGTIIFEIVVLLLIFFSFIYPVITPDSNAGVIQYSKVVPIPVITAITSVSDAGVSQYHETIETLQKLVLANEIYYLADLDENYKNDYAPSIKSLVENKAFQKVIFNTPGHVAEKGSYAIPYTGYFYRSIPAIPRWDYVFVFVAYPEKPDNKTFVVCNWNEKYIIYSKELGNLKYPDKWDLENDPTKYGWLYEARVEITDEILKNTYQKIIARPEPVLTEKDKEIIQRLKDTQVSLNLTEAQSLASVVKQIVGDIDTIYHPKLSPDKVMVDPSTAYIGVEAELALVSVLSEPFNISYYVKDGKIWIIPLRPIESPLYNLQPEYYNISRRFNTLIGKTQGKIVGKTSFSGLQKMNRVSQLRDIRNYLSGYPEVFQWWGVLDGRPGYYVREKINFVSDSEISAYFKDGHCSGIQRIRITEGPKDQIVFEVLEETLDD